jgi:hypothetical protein
MTAGISDCLLEMCRLKCQLSISIWMLQNCIYCIAHISEVDSSMHRIYHLHWWLFLDKS